MGYGSERQHKPCIIILESTMYSALWCIVIAVALRCLQGKEDLDFIQLHLIRDKINNNTAPFCYHAHSGSRQAYISNQYRQFTEQHNILIYPFCLTTNELGNRLGNYFYEVTCAEASGLHFIAVHPRWELIGSLHDNLTEKDQIHIKNGQLAFLNALPTVIPHPAPFDRNLATATIQQVCKCTRYCWQYKAPWVNRTGSIKKYVQNAVHTYLTYLGEHATTRIETDDLTNAKEGEPLPLIPDVTIQYRCGDNIGFSYMYGILPFTVFNSRIPQNSKYIYVLSDHPSRANSSPFTSRCQLILEKLFEYLKNKFPNSTIVVKRGGDIFLDFARIASSRTVICSASSFCFWPAVSNDGNIHFPLTYLIAGADSIDLAPTFGPGFHWITDAQIISHFKGLKPWTQIIDVLEGRMQFPQR